jgi:hypothetical protein
LEAETEAETAVTNALAYSSTPIATVIPISAVEPALMGRSGEKDAMPTTSALAMDPKRVAGVAYIVSPQPSTLDPQPSTLDP